MPGSIGSGSLCSRRSSVDSGPKFDPFLVLDAHADHYKATSIVHLPETDKVFCPICLEMRSDEDVNAIEQVGYNRYVTDLFELLDRYGENEKLRRIVLTILVSFLPRRAFILERDDQFHKILRVLHRVMKSDHYNQSEFIVLTKIMSGISIKSLQPIPLRSAWEAWRCMLEYGQDMSVEMFIDNDNPKIPKNLIDFFIGKAIVVKTFICLINEIAKDRISDLIFLSHRHKQEPLTSKYYEASQKTCLRFVEEKLYQNCDCLLSKENPLSSHELQVVSELFFALRECFINAINRKDQQFLNWIHDRDLILTAHRILCRNSPNGYEAGVYSFLKAFTIHHIELEYGANAELAKMIEPIEAVETAASKVARLETGDANSKIRLFYLLLNWVAIKLDSRYYIAGRVVRVMRDSSFLDAVRAELMSSRYLMRVFAFVVAHTKSKIAIHNDLTYLIEEDWKDLFLRKKLADFRFTYCHETTVFEWACGHRDFNKLLNGNAIMCLIDRGIAQNNLVCTLRLLLGRSSRQVFCRYVQRYAKTLFERILPLGTNALDKSIASDFSSWMPALIQEAILRLTSRLDPHKRSMITKKLTNMLEASNLLLKDGKRSKFDPHLSDSFVVDFSGIMEVAFRLYKKRKAENHKLLIACHEFIALVLETNNPCALKLIQYIDFNLIGYMYHHLNEYQCGDSLSEAIAHVLVAYENLDYPLNHRPENTIYQISSGAYEWMMSSSQYLNSISVILVGKLYPSTDTARYSQQTASSYERACLVTGFLHMLCVSCDILENRSARAKIVEILRHDDFKYHPLYPYLLERAPQFRNELDALDDSNSHFLGPPSPDPSFASASDFEEEHISVSRILEQLNDDEGYKSASTISLPKNIYLSRIIEEHSSEYPGTQEWERQAFAGTQSMDITVSEKRKRND